MERHTSSTSGDLADLSTGMRAKPHLESRHRDRSEEASVDHVRSERKRRADRVSVQRSKEQFSFIASHDSYVQNWLAQTEAAKTIVGAMESRVMKKSITREQPDAFNTKDLHRLLQKQHPDVSGIQQKRYRSGRRNSSSDSSFLEPGLPLQRIDDRVGDETHTSTSRGARKEKYKRQNISVPNITSDTDTELPAKNPPKETFERRKRHKTHADRYELKQQKIEVETKQKSNNRYKNERRINRQRYVKKGGEALMRDFSPKNVRSDRLTIKPAHGPGLFNNGRASSPTRRKALPDLAFSEMSFLRSSKTQSEFQNKKQPSKQREKDQRAKKRAQDEISSYFNPGKQPTQDLDIPTQFQKQTKSASSLNETSTTAHRRPSYSASISNSIDLPGALSRGLGSRGPSEKGGLSSCQGREVNGATADRVPETEIGISNRAASYCSWLESIRSLPREDSVARTKCPNKGLSSTPDSVRKSLDDTGVFERTGLDRASTRQQRERRGGHHPIPPGLEDSEREKTQKKSALPVPPISVQPVAQRPPGSRTELYGQQDDDRTKIRESSLISPACHRLAPRAPPRDPDLYSKIPALAIENYEPDSGWSKKELQNIPDQRECNMHTENNERPLSRQALAMDAYLKRPPSVRLASKTGVHETRVLQTMSVPLIESKHRDEYIHFQPARSATANSQRIRIPLQSDIAQSTEVHRVSSGFGHQRRPRRQSFNESLISKANQTFSRPSLKSTLITDTCGDQTSVAANHLVLEPIRISHNHPQDKSFNDFISGSAGAFDVRTCTRSSNGLPTRGILHDIMENEPSGAGIVIPAATVQPLYQHQLSRQIGEEFEAPQGVYSDLHWKSGCQNAVDLFGLVEEMSPFEELDGERLVDTASISYQKEIPIDFDEAQWIQDDLDGEFGASMRRDASKTYDAQEINQGHLTFDNPYEVECFNDANYIGQVRLHTDGLDDLLGHSRRLETARIPGEVPFTGFWRPFRQY